MKHSSPAPAGSRVGFAKQVIALLGVLALTSTPGTVQAGKKPSPPPVDYPYSIRQLALPPGANSIGALGLNESGVVVGDADFPNYEWQACVWKTDGTIVMLPLLENAQVRRSTATRISDSGNLICGDSVIFVPPTAGLPYYDSFRATYWERVGGVYQAGSWNDLLPGELGIHLYYSQISADGQFAALHGPDRQTGVNTTVIAGIVHVNGRVAGIDVLDVLPETRPHDINFNGAGVLRVLGIPVEPGNLTPFVWKLDLNEVNAQPSLLVSGEATSGVAGAVNGLGQVVQTLGISGGASIGLLWENEAQLWDFSAATDLGSFGGPTTSPRDINDIGQTVGTSTTAGRRSEQRAFLFQNGSMVDLSTVAPVGKTVLSAATRINTARQILTSGSSGNSYGWFLLTPNP